MENNIILDINIALNNKAYLAALSLALTIPDICGKMVKEYGNYHYSKWFDEWVYPYHYSGQEEMAANIDDTNVKEVLNVNFNGIVCFLLRNSLFHEGNTNLKKVNGYEIAYFELFHNGYDDWQIGEMTGITTEGSIKKYCYRINIICLIKNIVEGYNRFKKTHPDFFVENDFVKLVNWDK